MQPTSGHHACTEVAGEPDKGCWSAVATNVQISMDGKERGSDNIFTERLWRTINYEEVYLREYITPKEAFHSLANYLHFSKHQRLHQSLDYRTPDEVYYAGQQLKFTQERRMGL